MFSRNFHIQNHIMLYNISTNKEEKNMNRTKALIKIYSTVTMRNHYILCNTREIAFEKMNELMKSYTDQGKEFIRIGSLTLYID